MVIFHSYVKLPEGSCYRFAMFLRARLCRYHNSSGQAKVLNLMRQYLGAIGDC